jgi:hypothetical protein
MTIRCDGQTCTCGIGPWSANGICDACGGTDLGMPLFALDSLAVRPVSGATEIVAGMPNLPIPTVPATTTPLTKFIRTLEGIIVLAANVTLIVVPIVTSSLTASQAVKYGVILDSIAVVARSVLKAVAALGTSK